MNASTTTDLKRDWMSPMFSGHEQPNIDPLEDDKPFGFWYWVMMVALFACLLWAGCY